MGYYTVDKTGSTEINEGSEKDPRIKKIFYEKGEPIEDVKKGQLDHVGGAEYHTGEPDESSGDEEEQEDGKKK